MLISRYIHWQLNSRNSRYWVILALLLVVISAIGLKNLKLASDYKIFFDEDDLELQKLEQLQERYNKTENVFIMIKPAEDSVYTEETIKLIHSLTEQLWQVPYTSRVDSITNYPYSFAEGDDILIEEFILDLDEVTKERVQFIANKVPLEPDLVGKLITQKGDYTAINLTMLFPNKDTKAETMAVNQAVDNIIYEFQSSNPNYSFYVSGIAIMNGAFIKAAKKDFVTLIPLMMILVLLIAGFLLGSFKAVGLLLSMLLLSFVGALGIAGWAGISLSAPSISAPIIMFTVIVASSIHILTYVKRRQTEGVLPYQAVIDAYLHNATPIVLSHITTIIGFLSMNASDSPPFRDLGNMVVFGVVFSLLLIFSVLPFFLAKIRFSNKGSVVTSFGSISNSVAEFVISNRVIIMALMVPIALAVAVLSVKSELNDSLIQYFDESVTFRQHAETVDKQFSGVYNIDYSIESQIDNGVFNHSFLLFVDQFESWLLDHPEVVAVDSPIHRIKDLNRLMHSDDDKYYRIPESTFAAAQNFLLYEMSLPFGRDTSHYVSLDKASIKLTIRLKNMSSQEVIKIEEQVNVWLSQHTPEALKVDYSSPAVIFSHIGSSSTVSLLQGATLALIIISLSLVLVFRSLTTGLVSLLPNILPIAAAFGVWHLLSGQVSMGLAGVAAMAIGIVVDDTVHFLFQYMKSLKIGLTPADSVRRTFNKTMPAILLSSLLLIIGFMLLASSSFEKNADLGVLTSITIFLALIFDMFLLPAIAMTFLKKHPQKNAMDDSQTGELQRITTNA